MRIGLVEFLIILAIASIAMGPQVAQFVDRWMRRANRTSARIAKKRAEYAALAAAECDDLLRRFRATGTWFCLVALAALVYALVLRPVDMQPQPYTPPAEYTGAAVRQSTKAGTLALDNCKEVLALRERDGWLYAAVRVDQKTSAIVRMDAAGSSCAQLLSVSGEITGMDFGADGSIWFTVVSKDGGGLYHAGYDVWGTAAQQVVSQIDGKTLNCPTAVTVAADGKVYFTDATAANAGNGAQAALRTELIAHAGSGWVYVYDPADLTVQRVMGGIAGADGLALSADGATLYVSDLGNRCIWSVDTQQRGLTAGGKKCENFAAALPGYPGALAMDEDGVLYISYRWSRSDWLEEHADGTLLRGVALRLSTALQEKLFALAADAPSAQAVDTADLSVAVTFTGGEFGSAWAVCPVGSRVYFGIADTAGILWASV